MLDNVTMVLAVRNPEAVLLKMDNAKTLLDGKTSKLLMHRGELDGLHLTLSGNVLRVKNSLQKYYHIGNSGLFTLKENQRAILKLSDHFSEDFNRAYVRAPEFGVNLTVESAPKFYLNEMVGFNAKGLKPFDSRDNKHTLYYQTEDYCFKCYDKSRESKLKSQNILRIEGKAKKSTRIFPTLKTVADYTSHRGFEVMGAKLVKLYKQVEFRHQTFNLQLGMKPNDIIALTCLNAIGLLGMDKILRTNCNKGSYYSSKGQLIRLIKAQEVNCSCNIPAHYLIEGLKTTLHYILNN